MHEAQGAIGGIVRGLLHALFQTGVMMPARIAAARIGLLIVFAALTAGCSSSHPKTAAGFKSDYLALEHDYRAQFAALQTQARAVVGKDISTQLTVFSKMSAATKTARDKLRGLVPPAKVKAVYDRLVVALTNQQSTLRRIEIAARANDETALNSSLSGYASALQNGISLLRQMDGALGVKTS